MINSFRKRMSKGFYFLLLYTIISLDMLFLCLKLAGTSIELMAEKSQPTKWHKLTIFPLAKSIKLTVGKILLMINKGKLQEEYRKHWFLKIVCFQERHVSDHYDRKTITMSLQRHFTQSLHVVFTKFIRHLVKTLVFL